MEEKYKLILGDCIEKMKDIPDESIDCVITDPPYGLDKNMANDKIEGLDKLLTNAIKEMCRVIKDKHSILMFFDCGKNLPIAFHSIQEGGGHFERYIQFYKPNDCSMPHNRVLRKSEALLLFSKSGVLHHEGEKFMHDVIIGNVKKQEYGHFYHPSVKSLDIIKKLILVNTHPNYLILDPFMGSGTTGVACMNLNRKFIGIEISKDYYDIAEKRIHEASLNQKLSDL